MERLGRIVRLQVQVAPLKHGPDRAYDPARIRSVDVLEVTAAGVVGHVDGDPTAIVDVHHRDHPQTRHRGHNGLSLGVTGHYAVMRERCGPRAAVGVGGENLLLEHDARLCVADLAAGVTVSGARGAGEESDPLVLGPAAALEPCVPFTEHLLGGQGDESLRGPLTFLRGGTRGFALPVVAGAGTRVRVGDVVLGHATGGQPRGPR